jgi:hypothetical protein
MSYFPLTRFPQFSNAKASLENALNKLRSASHSSIKNLKETYTNITNNITNMDPKELAKKASFVALGSFVTAGTAYLGYKKLVSGDVDPVTSTHISTKVVAAAAVFLPVIALTKFCLNENASKEKKELRPMLQKENASKLISPELASEYRVNPEFEEKKEELQQDEKPARFKSKDESIEIEKVSEPIASGVPSKDKLIEQMTEKYINAGVKSEAHQWFNERIAMLDEDSIKVWLSKDIEEEQIKKINKTFERRVAKERDKLESAYFMSERESEDWDERVNAYDPLYSAYLLELWPNLPESSPWFAVKQKYPFFEEEYIQGICEPKVKKYKEKLETEKLEAKHKENAEFLSQNPLEIEKSLNEFDQSYLKQILDSLWYDKKSPWLKVANVHKTLEDDILDLVIENKKDEVNQSSGTLKITL